MPAGVTSENEPSAFCADAINGYESKSNDAVPVTEKPVQTTSPWTAPSQTSIAVLERLARQVEYYFSDVNLEKDAYVSTLRSLNDGYVPLSIISNFGKVRTLVPHDTMESVRKAVTDYGDLLEVVLVDMLTGKRVDEAIVASTTKQQTTIEAVGPKTGEPIPIDSIQKYSASPVAPMPIAGAPIQNTVIIREVPEGTDDSHIRDLFSFKPCPPIQSLHLDVANCWFVTLDTTSKDEMVNVMLQLRSKKFQSGEPVKARLKSAVVANADASPVVLPFTNTGPLLFGAQLYGGNKKGSNKKKKSAGNKGKNGNGKTAKSGKEQHDVSGDHPHQNVDNGSNVQKSKGKKNASTKQEQRSKSSKGSKQVPPSLGEDQFPALQSDDLMNKNMVEVEKLPEHGLGEDEKKAIRSSDSASTATTSSSSSKNTGTSQPSMGGYAAALLKPAPPAVKVQIPEESKTVTKTETGVGKKQEKTSVDKNVVRPKERSTSTKPSKQQSMEEPIVNRTQVPSWGGGRSFADVLRKEAAAVTTCEQSA